MVKWAQTSAVSIATFALLILFQSIGLFQSVENLSGDFRMRWSGAQPSDRAIAIIAIDDKSINELGKWPWNREVHTKFLNNLADVRPRVVVFDVLFSEKSENAATDEELAKAMNHLKKQQVQTVLAEYGQFSLKAKKGGVQVENLIKPIPLLQSSPSGHINVLPDDDGVLRKGLFKFNYNGRDVPSIDQVAAETYSGFPVKEAKIPLDPINRWAIPYAKDSTYPVYSYVDILNGNVPASKLKDKLLLIGPTSIGLSDHYPTPIGSIMNGIEIHAYMIDALLHDRYITVIDFQWLFILLFVIIGQVFARRFSLKWGVSLTVLSAIAYALLSYYLLDNYRLLLTVVSPTVALLVSYAAQIGYNYFLERKERQHVTRLFGRFVAPQVVDEILRLGEDNVKLGGVKRYISVLFLDVRGFTPLSEKLTPEEVVDVLNSFFSEITAAIFEHGGTLDKFIGDAVMAIWNAPLPVENHELQAVKTAIQIQRSAQKIQKEIENKYGRTVAFGIGVNCGEAVVGNIGAMQRLDYTAIGDTVNLAARLESNAKPNQIIISEQVYQKIVSIGSNDISIRSLGSIQVKGKSQPVSVFEVEY